MAYIGVQPTAGQYRKLDNISASFDGSTTVFTTSVDGIPVTAGSPQQLLVSLNGVIKQPKTDYGVNTNTIVFTSAPTGGTTFFAVLMGDALNAGTPADGSITTAKLGLNLTVDLAAGSAAAPSLTLDPTTGIYSPGTDQLAISTGGSQRLLVDSSGAITAGSTITAGGTIQALQTFQSSSGTDVVLNANGANRDAIFKVNGSELMRLQGSTGRLGIGTSSPRSTLNLNSTNGAILTLENPSGSNVSGDYLGRLQYYGNDVSPSSAGVRASIDALATDTGGSTSLVFSTTDFVNTTLYERLRITSTGNVGIGTTSPASIVELNAQSPTLSISSQLGFGSSIEFKQSGTAYGRVRFDGTNFDIGNLYSAGATIIYAGNAERLRITSGGLVGIGTTTVSDKLHIDSGNIRITGAGSQYIQAVGTNLNFNTDSQNITFNRSGTEMARFDSSSRLLVGTSTAPTGTLSQYSKFSVYLNNQATSAGGQFNLVGGARGLLSTGDKLGQIIFTDSTDGEYGKITCELDATPGASDYPGRLVFSTTADGASSPTERMRISNVGGLKVSSNGAAYVTTATNAQHEITTDINGSEALYVTNRNSTSPLGVQIYYSTDINNTANYFLTCYGTSNLRAGFRSNGGLANYSANNVNLSDRNVKKDIAPAAGTWNCLKEWEIVNFRYKDQPNDADLNMGVIAQQVAESCPDVIQVFQEAKEATATEPAQEERIGVKEQQMMWMAIKALQEAQVRIEKLEKRLADAGIA